MNAITFLINEHEKVRKTLIDIDEGNHREETKRKRFEELCKDLVRHETMEHKVWYPHFKNNSSLSDTVKHLLKEEKFAEKTIEKLKKIKTQEEWEEKFLKFKKDVEHHAKEEELKLFPQVCKILSIEDLDKIGIEMREFNQNYKE